MKKIFTSILCALTLVLCLSGCGGNKQIDMEGLANELMSAGIFDEDLESVSDSITAKRLSISAGAVEEGISYVGTKAVVDEIVILKATNDQGKESIENGIKSHIETQKKSYQSYAPNEVSKLEDCVVISSGNYEILVVSNDNAQAKKIVNNYIK